MSDTMFSPAGGVAGNLPYKEKCKRAATIIGGPRSGVPQNVILTDAVDSVTGERYATRDYGLISEYLREQVDSWRTGERTEVDHFIRAVLDNDLAYAMVLASEYETRIVGAIVRYCMDTLSPNIWGSREKTEAWERKQRERRRERALGERAFAARNNSESREATIDAKEEE
jgi:hypothetical protein